MTTRGPLAIFFSAIISFLVVIPLTLLIVAPGSLRDPEKGLTKGLFMSFVAGLLYFGPGIIIAAVGSGILSILALRLSNVVGTLLIIVSPAVLLPLAIASLMAYRAGQGVPLINRGDPYVYASVVGGLVVGGLIAWFARAGVKGNGVS